MAKTKTAPTPSPTPELPASGGSYSLDDATGVITPTERTQEQTQ